MSRFLGKLIVTGLGTGYLPIAPGTWGSAAVAGLFVLVAWTSGGSGAAVLVAMGIVLAGSCIGCVALGRFTEAAWSRKDPSQCTVDELAGQALALLLVPVGTMAQDWLVAAGVAFVCFRVFDIIKPPPARDLEKLPHGWGILADDLMAGIYANIVTQIVLRWCYGLGWGL